MSPRQFLRKLVGRLERYRIGDREFILVSNNCWGYRLYNDLGRSYNTPFVGLFMMPDCYLAMLADFDRSMSSEIGLGWTSRYHDTPRTYPVGILPCGSEVHFLHYPAIEEAGDKWRRRCERLRKARAAGLPIYLKFCDFLGATDEQLQRFHACELGTKVSFGVRPFPSPAHVHVPHVRDKSGDRVPNGARLYLWRNRCFDIVDWIRDGVVHRTPLSRLLALFS